jgi:hypothetical protein
MMGRRTQRSVMATTPNQAPRQGKRAKRVALRTIQRRPNIIGENEAGEPIVEVGSVRLVLPQGAQYLHHLSTCTRCSGEALGDEVTNASDLQRRPSNVFCDECARVSGTTGRLVPEVAEPAPDVPPSPRPVAIHDAGLEQQAQLLATELGGVLANRFDQGLNQLGTLLANRFDQGLNQLGAALATRLDSGLGAMANAPEVTVGMAEEDLQVLGTALAARFDRRLNELGTALADRFDEKLRESVVRSGPLEDDGHHLVGRVDAPAGEGSADDHDNLAARLQAAMLDGRSDEREAPAAELESVLADPLEARVLATVSGALEQGFAELQTTLDARLDEKLKGLAEALAGKLRDDRNELASRVESALREELEQRVGLGPELERALSGPLEKGLHEVRVALGTRLEEGLAELARAIAGRMRDDQAKLVSQVEVAVRRGLEQERQALASEVGTALSARLEERFDELEGTLGGWMEEDQKMVVSQLQSTLREGLEEQRETLDSELGVLFNGRFEQGLRELGARLSERSRRDHDQLVSQLAETLRASREHDRSALMSEGASALADVDNRIRSARDELYERLEQVAERAAEAGAIAARSLLHSTEEYTAATAVSLAGGISALQRETSAAEQRLTQVLEAVEGFDRRLSLPGVGNESSPRKAPGRTPSRKSGAKNGLKPSGERSEPAKSVRRDRTDEEPGPKRPRPPRR